MRERGARFIERHAGSRGNRARLAERKRKEGRRETMKGGSNR